MKTIYFRIAFIAAFLSISATSGAQVMNSLIRDLDPAAAGIAGASVAMKADAYSLYNNSAAMSLYDGRMAFAGGYGILQPSSVKMGAISGAALFKVGEKMALGAGFERLGYETYDITSAEGRSTAQFTPSEIAFSLGASYKIIEGLSAGAKLGYASISLSPDTKQGVFCGDIGLAYSAGQLSAGLNARNLGSKVMDVRAGASYEIASVVTAYAQGEYLSGAGVMGALGAQYAFKDMLFARAGYHLGSASKAIPSYASLGLGAKIIGITFDAAFLLGSRSETGTMLFSLGYSF